MLRGEKMTKPVTHQDNTDIISIIIPVYNIEKYLSKCLESIAIQSYQNLEILLIDDGSSDRSPEICDAYKKKDKRFCVIHKENGGLSSARNAGIEIASGKYLLFVDGDDYIDKDMVKILYKRIKQDKSDMAFCNYLVVQNGIEKVSGEKLRNELWTWKDYWNYYFKYYGLACELTVNKLYARHLFGADIRFPPGRLHEDEFILHKIIDRCRLISSVSNPLYYYVQRDGSIVHNQFSVRRLDVVDALIGREQYFYERGLKKFAEYSLIAGQLIILDADTKLDLSDKQNKKVYKAYEQKLREEYKVMKKNASLHFRIRAYLLFYHKPFYKMLQKFVHRFVKRR